jgi:hypothetical protein
MASLMQSERSLMQKQMCAVRARAFERKVAAQRAQGIAAIASAQ